MAPFLLARYVDPTFPNPGSSQDAPIIIYGYTPSFILAILGVVLFLLSTITHTYQNFRYRTWYFMPIVFGTAMEVVGYVFRIFSAKKDPYNVLYYVIQYFFIVVAPVFFSAAIYIVLSVWINRVGRAYSPVAPGLILWLFIVCDALATVVQIAGAASVGSAYSKDKDPTTANNILLAGLSFQVFSFLTFLIMLSIFLYRSRKLMEGMRGFVIAFVAATLFIYLRTCFRLAETAQGLEKSLSSREIYFGCLEFAPVVIAVYLFNGWHPGKWVSRNERK